MTGAQHVVRTEKVFLTVSSLHEDVVGTELEQVQCRKTAGVSSGSEGRRSTWCAPGRGYVS